MSAQVKAWIDAMRQSHAELAAQAGALSPDQLATTSGSSEWTVASVLSHLGSAAEIGRATLQSGKADMEGARAIWARWDAMAPADQAAGFVEADAALVDAYGALSDAEIGDARLDLGFLPAPVGIDIVAAMRLSELALHRWDIDVAFDPDATVASYLIEPTLSLLPVFGGFFAKPGGAKGQVAFTTSDPTGSYLLTLAGESADLSADPGAADTGAGTTVQLPAESFVRLTSGRLRSPAGVTCDGEMTFADLQALFPGY